MVTTMAEKQNKDFDIGYHKGSIFTLMKEREGLAQMVGIVEQSLQGHIKALKELGIDFIAELKAAQEKSKSEKLDEKVK